MGNSFSNIEVNDRFDNSVLFELGLLLVTLKMVSSHLEEQEISLQSLLLKVSKDHNEERHRQSQTKETSQPSQRTFHEITQRMSEKAFQRTFRMQRKSFYKLCALIVNC
jgi:DNA anti-recombination protein RmuC